MMEPELMQQLRVDDPMEEPELNLDGIEISSIQVLLEPPPTPGEGDETDEDDGFYSPLDHFLNLVKLSMSSAQCQSLEAFPHLPLLRSLVLADNDLSSGFEALAEADLQSLERLDLSGNMIADVSVLKPLVALGNLQHLLLAENDVMNDDNYRSAVFHILPQLITVDGLDRDGTEIDVDDDEDLSSDDDGHHHQYMAEDIDSQSDSELEDQENRRPMVGGKTSGDLHHIDNDEDDDDELEDEEDDEGVQQQHHAQDIVSGSEDDDDEEEEDEDEDEDEDDDDDEGDDAPGLAYLMTENIPDDNDDEFEPGNEVEEESEIESSDEDEYGSRNAHAQSSSATSATSGGNTTNTNGHHLKRPRSRSPPTTSADFDHSHTAGFDVDGDDATNGFGMASFDGPATFDDEASHESKRPRA